MVTIKDVAKKSGFSVATVSAVINGAPIVSPKAKEKILEAIKELGYRPNAIARSLKNAKTSSIGIILRDITNPHYSEIVSGLEEIAWTNNYEVFLCNTENSLERELKYIDNLMNKRVDGIVIATSSLKREQYYDKLRMFGIPYVFLNRRPEELFDYECYVGGDNRLASVKVIDHLYQLGYSRIAYLGGPINFSTFHERLSGFLEGMEKYGLVVRSEWVRSRDEYTMERGYEEAKQFIHNHSMPEVIFCSSDLLAFGVYMAFKKEGICIPDDVALISIDDNRFGDLIELSSVNMQNKEMGRQATKMLMRLLNNEPIDKREVLLEPQLIIRKSCGGQSFKSD